MLNCSPKRLNEAKGKQKISKDTLALIAGIVLSRLSTV